MELEKTAIKTKCDFCGCKNLAMYTIASVEDGKKRMNFCENCLNEIYQTYAKSIIPKGIEAPFKKKKKIG